MSLLFKFSPPPVKVGWIVDKSSAIFWSPKNDSNANVPLSPGRKSGLTWEGGCAFKRRRKEDKVPRAPKFVAMGMNWSPQGQHRIPLPHWPRSNWLGNKGVLGTSFIFHPTNPGAFQPIIHLSSTNITINYNNWSDKYQILKHLPLRQSSDVDHFIESHSKNRRR